LAPRQGRTGQRQADGIRTQLLLGKRGFHADGVALDDQGDV
jgi:hypothetical protein